MRFVTNTGGFIGRQLSHMLAASYNCGFSPKRRVGWQNWDFLDLESWATRWRATCCARDTRSRSGRIHREKAKELAAAEKGMFCATPREVAETRRVRLSLRRHPDHVGAGDSGRQTASSQAPSRRRRRRRQHHLAQRQPQDRRSTWRRRESTILDAPCTGSTPGANERHPDLYGWRRREGLRAESGPGSKPWARSSTTAAARAWGCTPS